MRQINIFLLFTFKVLIILFYIKYNFLTALIYVQPIFFDVQVFQLVPQKTESSWLPPPLFFPKTYCSHSPTVQCTEVKFNKLCYLKVKPKMAAYEALLVVIISTLKRAVNFIMKAK